MTRLKSKEARVVEIAKVADISEEKAEGKIEIEEGKLKASPMGRFIVLEVVGGFRVAKNHQWISGAISSKDAVKLASDLNRKDPEQKPYNRYLVEGKAPAMRGLNDIKGL